MAAPAPPPPPPPWAAQAVPAYRSPVGWFTADGLERLQAATDTLLVANVFWGVLGLWAAVLLASGSKASLDEALWPLQFLNFLGLMVGFVAIAKGAGALSSLRRGKDEFGPARAAAFSKSLVWLYIALPMLALVVLIATIAEFEASMAAGTSLARGGEVPPADSGFAGLLLASALGAAGFTVLMARFMEGLLAGLLGARARRLRVAFYGFSLAGAAALLVVTLWVGSAVASMQLNVLQAATAGLATALSGWVSVGSMAAYRLMVRQARAAVRASPGPSPIAALAPAPRRGGA